MHLLWRGTPELIEEHVKGGEARVVPPMLNYYVQVSRLVPRGNGRPPLDVVFKELGYKSRRHALIEYGHNGALQPTLMRYAFAGRSAGGAGDQRRRSLTNSARSGILCPVLPGYGAYPASPTPLDPSNLLLCESH